MAGEPQAACHQAGRYGRVVGPTVSRAWLGAAAVTGGGFITPAATLASTGSVPVEGLALLLGVDRFMSECRAITNLIGNGVATLVVARWEKELDQSRLESVLTHEPAEEADETLDGLMAAEPVDHVRRADGVAPVEREEREPVAR